MRRTFLLCGILAFVSSIVNAFLPRGARLSINSLCQRLYKEKSWVTKMGTIESGQTVMSPEELQNSQGTRNRIKEIWGKTESGQEFYRRYPFESLGLPVLFDVNNYYSGTWKEVFWHQNADQVLIFIPLLEYGGDDLIRRDISANFDHHSVKVVIKDQTILDFVPIQKINPDGCFWSFETSTTNGRRYLQIDLEKKSKYTNWKGLFADVSERELSTLDLRSQLLQKLHNLNQAASDGSSQKTVEELLQDPQLMEALLTEVEMEQNQVETKQKQISDNLQAQIKKLEAEQNAELTKDEKDLIDALEVDTEDGTEPSDSKTANVIDIDQL